jgi:hypothetical protein
MLHAQVWRVAGYYIATNRHLQGACNGVDWVQRGAGPWQGMAGVTPPGPTAFPHGDARVRPDGRVGGLADQPGFTRTLRRTPSPSVHGDDAEHVRTDM